MEKTLYKFYADWCGPCKLMKPVVDKLAAEYNLKVVEVNIDHAPTRDMVRAYHVQGIPTLVLEEDGKEKARITGSNTLARTASVLGLTA